MEPTPSTATDAELLRASGEDAAAFAEFYRRHERLVLGWCSRRAATGEDAADLTAEIFAAAWLGRDGYRAQTGGAAPWLLGIAQNKLLMSIRQRRIERSASEKLRLERILIDDQTLREVEALFSDAEAWLRDLPADQREAVRAYVLDDEHYDEIARRLCIREPTARKRVSRGLARLRRTVKDQGASR